MVKVWCKVIAAGGFYTAVGNLELRTLIGFVIYSTALDVMYETKWGINNG